MRILLVEDDQRISEFLVKGLTEAGHHLILADSGEKARDFIETYHSFLEFPYAALSNITSYVSATEVLVKNRNTFKVLKNGVLKGIGEIFPQSYTTATRPTASSQGVGAMIFDTNLNKPIWSDGSAWKDATGTAV